MKYLSTAKQFLKTHFKTLFALVFLAGLSGYFSKGLYWGKTCNQIENGSGQCWDQGDISWWYKTSQGSRLLPKSWFMSLERADSAEKFSKPKNMERYHYIQQDMAQGSLPVGFAIDPPRARSKLNYLTCLIGIGCPSYLNSRAYVGLTCAACHTAKITFNNKSLLIQGAPAQSDFQSFLEDLRLALKETYQNKEKFVRFARGVAKEERLKTKMSAAFVGALRQNVGAVIEWFDARYEKNFAPGAPRYGFGRLDAQSHILNKVALVADPSNVFDKKHLSDAPTSYPQLWNIHQHDKLQWNGLAQSDFLLKTDIGALGRNVGEVIGVFAEIKPDNSKLNGYKSSIRLKNIMDLEKLLHRLRSPKWPEQLLGKPDPDKVAMGEKIFAEKCWQCHTDLEQDDLTTPIRAEMTPVYDPQLGTDIWTACNPLLHVSKTGLLFNKKDGYIRGKPLKEVDSTVAMLRNMIAGGILGQAKDLKKEIGKNIRFIKTPDNNAFQPALGSAKTKKQTAKSAKRTRLVASLSQKALANRDYQAFFKRKEGQKQSCENLKNHPLMKYKGRPLNGIWATAPFLHNGSVPTLYDLLLPEKERPTSFYVGSSQFDANKVGYKSKKEDFSPEELAKLQLFEVQKNGKDIPGNSNKGHSYGKGLSLEQRDALLEYMKSL